MNTRQPRSRFRMYLAAFAILCSLAGCSSFMSLGMSTGPTFTPSTTDIQPQPARARPSPTQDRSSDHAAPAPKHRIDDPEYDKRHPSRWNKKLRAKYA